MARQARHRLLAPALAALALVLAGCGASNDEGISGGGKVIGRTVTVYSLTTDPGGAGRDFVDAEKLALADAGGRAGALAVNFTSLDLGGADDRAPGAGRPARDLRPADHRRDRRRHEGHGPALQRRRDPPGGGERRPEPGRATRRRCRRASAPSAALPPEAPPADFEARFAKEFGRDPAPSAAEGYAP